MATEVEDRGFNYEQFFIDRKANPLLKLPRQEAKETLSSGYHQLYDTIGGELEFDVEAPHDMFELEICDSKWEMVDALRGQKFDDSTRNLRIRLNEGRYTISNQNSGTEIQVIYDTTSPQKFVTEPRKIPESQVEPNMWLLTNARFFASGRTAGHMDHVDRIDQEKSIAQYWNNFLSRAVKSHFGSLARERQSIMAA